MAAKDEFGHTKLFQNVEQKILYEAVGKAGTSSVAELIKDRKVKKIVSLSAGDDSEQARKVRLRGRLRVLRRRLKARGVELPE